MTVAQTVVPAAAAESSAITDIYIFLLPHSFGIFLGNGLLGGQKNSDLHSQGSEPLATLPYVGPWLLMPTIYFYHHGRK